MKINEEIKKTLLSKAKGIINNSYSPYSKFKVAAALICEDNSIFTGVNVENSSYGLTNCAERSAVFSAVSSGHKDIAGILILTEEGEGFPCGACRQVLAEFNPDMAVFIAGLDGIKYEKTVSELLPLGFSGDFLKK